MSSPNDFNNYNLSNMINGKSDVHDQIIPFADDDYINGYINGIKDTGDGDADDDDDHKPIENKPKRKKSLGERRQIGNLTLNIVPKEINVQIETPATDRERIDEAGPLLQIPTNTRLKRRNSISLPALNNIDLLALQQIQQNDENNNDNEDSDNHIMEDDDRVHDLHDNHNHDNHHHNHHVRYEDHVGGEDGESMVCSIAQESHDDDEEEYFRRNLKKSKFRSKRKLSIAPLPSFRLNDKEMIANEFDSHSVISNNNSITSINSLASLLKEKIQMFPAIMKKKRKSSDDLIIKAFVATLFLLIVFLVGFAYITYHNQVLARSYFDKVKFNKAKRQIRVFDSKGLEIITGKIGISLSEEKPYNCKINDEFGSVCLEWNDRARLYLNTEEMSQTARCYTIKWESLGQDFIPTDCYDVSEEKGFWFGGGLTKNADWPLQKASFDFSPFITGDTKVQQWGNVLKRYFINSRGVAITIDDKVPLYISMNYNESSQFCLQAKNDNFAFVNRLTPLPVLSYKICTGDDMRSLHKQMTQQSLWDGINEKDVSIVHSLLEEPVWQIPTNGNEELNETTIYNYTEKVIALSFLKLGHVLLNEFWQETIGDFSLDIERFPTFESTVNMLHRRGFRISLTVQPFISTESTNFGEAVAKKLLIYERLSERSIPAMTRYKSSASSGVLDVTNNDSIPWLLDQLQKVKELYKINSFFLDIGTAYNMPHYYQCIKSLDNPDQYKTIFMSRLEEGLTMIGVSGGVSVPRPPAFLSLPPVNSSWDSLQTIVTTVLTYGIIGYPFIMPGNVGGDYLLPRARSKMITFYSLETPPLPEEELYIRWFQLATFLPVLKFTHLPSEYGSELVNEVSKELAMIRENIVTPTLKRYLTDAMNEALPLIRPLWMVDPLDVACLTVNDEFSIGEEVIVAPILQKGVIQREVYLPQGVWKDGIDGSLRKGSRWIHNYKVPQNKVAFFVKMPDNTRF